MELPTAALPPACATEAGPDDVVGSGMMPAEQVCWGAEAMEIDIHAQDLQRGDVAHQNDFDGTADMETDSSHTIEGRARDHQALGEAAASSNGQSGHAAADAWPGPETPAEQVEQPAAPPSEQQLAERAATMFVVGARAPVASGMPAAAQEATKELVLRAWSAISALCKANGKQLSSSFGNFDKVVGLGWLLGDVVLGYLIAGEDALAVGRKAGKLAAGLKEEFAVPLRRAGKQKFVSADARARAMAEAAAAEAALRREPVPLPFPSRQRAAQAAASMRRRVAAAPPVPGPEPTPEPDCLVWYDRADAHMEFLVSRAAAAQAEAKAAGVVALDASRACMRAERAVASRMRAVERLPKRWPVPPSLRFSEDDTEEQVNEKTAKRAALLEQEQAAKSELMEAKFDASEARTKAREAKEDVEHATRELETWEATIKEYQGYLQRCFERDHEWYESLTAAPVPSAVAESPDA
jgi:hypothetical protein